MAEVVPKNQTTTIPRSNAANNTSKGGASLAPPVFQLQANGKGVVGNTAKTVIPKSEKEELQDIFDNALNGGASKEEAFDVLADYIAGKTKAIRLKKDKSSLFQVTDDSIKLSGNAEAMEYLHGIGYWKDKPRRLVKASNELYDQFTASKDAAGNRTESYNENQPEVTDAMSEIISVTRFNSEDEIKKYNDDLKKKKSSYKVYASTDKTTELSQGDSWAWSAHTISKFHHAAGSGNTFHYSDGHTTYAKSSKKNILKDDISGIEKLYPAFDQNGLKDSEKELKKYKEKLLAENKIDYRKKKEDKELEVNAAESAYKLAKTKGDKKQVEQFKRKWNTLKKELEELKKLEINHLQEISVLESKVEKYERKVRSQSATPVKIGDTLFRSRNSKKSYKSIHGQTHSDIVVDFEVYSGKKGSLSKYGNYDSLIKSYETDKLSNPDLEIDDFAEKNNLKVYAVVIGGNTKDFSDPDTPIPMRGDYQTKEGGQTLGKNFIPLNPDKTIKEKTPRNNIKEYEDSDAYFGVQRTDYRE